MGKGVREVGADDLDLEGGPDGVDDVVEVEEGGRVEEGGVE